MTDTSPENKAATKTQGLARSGIIVSMMTLISRVLGLVRDVIIAQIFGASAPTDAFFIAFKIPNFFRRLFAEGAFSQAFVPVLTAYTTERRHSEVKQLVAAVSGTLGAILLVVTALGIAGSPWLTALFAPGYLDQPFKFELAQHMLQITFAYLLFISLAAFAGSTLNAYGQFAIPSFTPVLLNIALIAAAIVATPWFSQPIFALAWAVLFAGVLQWVFQLPSLLRLGLLPRPRLDYKHEGVARIFKLMLPALFGVSVSQINLMLDTILASFLETGSVTWLYLSDRLAELPLGVIAIALATVILPALSAQHVKQSPKAFSDTLDWALKLVILIGFPASAALIYLSEGLMVTLFGYGEMTSRDLYQSAASLRAYAIALLAFMLIKVLATGYFSRQDTATPVRVGVIAMVANMALNLALIIPLAHVGLALATALSAWLNASLLYRGLRRESVYQPGAGWRSIALKVFASSVLMIMVLSFLDRPTDDWMADGLTERIIQTLILVIAGIVTYFLALRMLGLHLLALLKSGKIVNS